MKIFSFTTLALGALVVLAAFSPNTSSTASSKGGDIVDVAIGANFNTLVAAVQAAGLEETLRGDGPFTVFAPTDEAFAALPEGTLDSLLDPENIEQLQAILTYHVIAGEVMSTDLLSVASTATVNGQEATFGLRVGGANVTAADISASNGVIHVIDQVLIP